MQESGPAWEGRNAAYWREALHLPRVHVHATIPSTNDVARDLAEGGAPHLTLVLADHQTRGRGRGGRSWHSAPGSSLLCSLIFRYHAEGGVMPGTAPVRLGYAVAEAIARVAGTDSRVKWPNDVVIAGHGKVAGILCEGAARSGDAYVIAGIGVNVHNPGDGYVSLSDAAGHPISRAELLVEIVACCRQVADLIADPFSDAELAAMQSRDALLDEMIEDDNGLRGRALGVARDGSLLVQTSTGPRAIHNATIRLADGRAYPGVGA